MYDGPIGMVDLQDEKVDFDKGGWISLFNLNRCYLDRARDLFCFMAFTSLRYSK